MMFTWVLLTAALVLNDPEAETTPERASGLAAPAPQPAEPPAAPPAIAAPAAPAVTPLSAQATPPAPAPRRPAFLRIGVGAGASADKSPTMKAKTTERGAWIQGSVFGSFQVIFSDRLSLVAIVTRFARGPAGYLTDPLYGLAVAPRLVLATVLPPPANIGHEIYLLSPAGLTTGAEETPSRRAIVEKNELKVGWYAGAGIGWAMLGPGFGGFVELAYARHSFGIRNTVAPRDGSQPPTITDFHQVAHQVLMNVGLLMWH